MRMLVKPVAMAPVPGRTGSVKPLASTSNAGGHRLEPRCNLGGSYIVSADPCLAAWRLARAGNWDRFECVLRHSAAARSFIRMLPYQMYFDGYQRAEHIARVIDAQEAAACRDDEERDGPRTAAIESPGSRETGAD